MILKNLLSIVAAAALATGCASKTVLRGPLTDAPPVRSASFRQAMGGVLGAPFLGGNRITTLVNGDQICPAMLAAIGGARRTITFETYVFEKGEVPARFAEALAERARAGVKVHVILDAHGASKARAYHKLLEAAGVQLERYHHVWHPDLFRYNSRTHRKLLVVDGRIGFIGGVGIADEWRGNAQSPEHWRETHYRVEGPVVALLQGAFSENWQEARKEILTGADYFPPLPAAGSIAASVFYGSPKSGNFAVPLMYHLAIASARESLKIENAYFVPDEETMEALILAAKRGVRVELNPAGRAHRPGSGAPRRAPSLRKAARCRSRNLRVQTDDDPQQVADRR